MSLFRLFDEPEPEPKLIDNGHPGKLCWPGLDGIPFAAPPGSGDPLLKDHEIDELAQKHVYRARMFQLWLPEDLAAFMEVQQHMATGWFVQTNRMDKWIEDQNHLMVWLEWVQQYWEQSEKRVE